MPKVVSETELKKSEKPKAVAANSPPIETLKKRLAKKHTIAGGKITEKPKRKPGRPRTKSEEIKDDATLHVVPLIDPEIPSGDPVKAIEEVPAKNLATEPSGNQEVIGENLSTRELLDDLIEKQLAPYAKTIIDNHIRFASSRKHPQLAYKANKDLIDRLFGKTTTRKVMDEEEIGLAVRMNPGFFTRESDIPDASEKPDWADDAELSGDDSEENFLPSEGDLEDLYLDGDEEEEDEEA